MASASTSLEDDCRDATPVSEDLMRFQLAQDCFVPNQKRAFPMVLERGCPSAASQLRRVSPTEATADFFI
jgi:hypothetical protein